MRTVLDTKVLLSALITREGIPGQIVDAWTSNAFILLTHERQIDEIRTVTRRPRTRALLRAAEAGRLVNQMRADAVFLGRLSAIQRSADPADDFLLAICQAGSADYLVTGDKAGLLALVSHGATAIVTARQFLDLIG